MMHRPLDGVLSAFAHQTILVLGDVMLDEYVWGRVQRISPEAPVPVVEFAQRTDVPGGAANTAVNVAALGGRALLAGVVGADEPADRLREALARAGVFTDGLSADDERPTTTKTRVLTHGRQVLRLDRERVAPLPRAIEDRLLGWAADHLGEVTACVLSDYAKGVVSARLAERLLRMARGCGKPVVVDPKGADFGKYRGATLVKPNLQEAACVLGRPVGGESMAEAGRLLQDALGGGAVLLTRGAEGMTLFPAEGGSVHIPAVARQVFDVTGAGDTVAATLALALGAGATLEQAARLANWAAGAVVGKVGTASVGPHELAG